MAGVGKQKPKAVLGKPKAASGAAPNTVLGLDHLVLRVADLAASIAFYRRVLGARVERQLKVPRIVQLRIGESLLDLVPGGRGRGSKGAGANLDHFAVQVAALDHADLVRKLAPWKIVPDLPKDRYGAQGYGDSIYFHDIDGNMVELKGPATRPRILRGRSNTGPRITRGRSGTAPPRTKRTKPSR